MRRLKRTDQAPPDFFRWTCAETGFRVEAVDYPTWVEKAIKHLKANNLPVPDDLEAQMQEQICHTLPPEHCEFHDGTWVNIRLDWADIVTGTKALVMAAMSGLVPQAEAERRAKICVSCPLNVRVGGCTSCKVAKYLIGAIAKRKTSLDSRLLNCANCKCGLLAKVHVPKNILDSVTANEVKATYPSWCWAK